MYDELTKEDIEKMREELDYRTRVLRPQLIDDVKTARAFGDLSENFEYKAAKREKNRNDSRVRYLERMIKTARVISGESAEDAAGLYDQVTIRAEDDGSERVITLVTTLRQNAPEGAYKQGVARRQGRPRPPRRRARLRQARRRRRLLSRHPEDTKRLRRRQHPDTRILSGAPAAPNAALKSSLSRGSFFAGVGRGFL